LPPFRQGPYYARLAKFRYAFIVNEREVVLIRVSFEGTNSRPQSRRAVPQRAAAPLPGTQHLSGHSGVSEAFPSMSLDSFAPEDASGVEMAVFPWAAKKRVLTGFGAWIMLLIIATEPEEHGTGRSHASSICCGSRFTLPPFSHSLPYSFLFLGGNINTSCSQSQQPSCREEARENSTNESFLRDTKGDNFVSFWQIEARWPWEMALLLWKERRRIVKM
jgi:hypothetical protein